MAKLTSLAWRLLLCAALVLNPVLGAASAFASDLPQRTEATADTSPGLPPCHAMGKHHAPANPEAGTPDRGHGCGCGNAACQFGACCLVGALDLAAPLFAPGQFAGAQALLSHDVREADAPPPARMIRPPIA